LTSRLLKKPSMVFSTPQFEKRGFRIAHIFNGLQPSKMTVHPCTVRNLSKNPARHSAGAVSIAALLLLAGISLSWSTESQAQESPGQFELTPFAGYRFGGTFYDEDTDNTIALADDASFGLILDIRESTNTQWEIIYSHQTTTANISELDIPQQFVDVDIHYLQGGGTLLGDGNKVRPYLAATIGGTLVDPASGEFEDDFFWSFSIGTGLTFRPAKRLGFRLEARAFGTLISSSSDLFCRSGPQGGLCAISVDGKILWQLETFAGIVLRF